MGIFIPTPLLWSETELSATNKFVVEILRVHRLRLELYVGHQALVLVHDLLDLLPARSIVQDLGLILVQVQRLGETPREAMLPDQIGQIGLALDVGQDVVQHEDATIEANGFCHNLLHVVDLIRHVMRANSALILPITREVVQLVQ